MPLLMSFVLAAAQVVPVAQAQSQATQTEAQFLPSTPAVNVSLSVNPPKVCATSTGLTYLNFDLIVANRSNRDLNIASIRASSRNRTGEMLEQKLLWQGATSLLGEQREVKAGTNRLVYNPFSFATAAVSDRIEYVVTFDNNQSAKVDVRPQSCRHKARLKSPLVGRIVILDGYDFLSHHRRMTWHDRDDLRKNRIVDNVYRFGIDLFLIDPAGNLYRGRGDRMEDWFSWNAPIRAAGRGTVTAVRDDMPDNPLGSEDYPKKRLSQDPMNSDGNYVQIDHGNGEFSTFTHLRFGSARVKVGDRVEPDQVIGSVGNSGSTPVPHLHYELRSGFGVQEVRSAPPYFDGIRLYGRLRSNVAVALDTGDVFIAR
jgi:hypothetical protein